MRRPIEAPPTLVSWTRCSRLAIALLLSCGASPCLHADDATAALGKQRAIDSPFEWEIRDAGHPVLGNIRFAVLKTPVETAVGERRVYSRAYVSCQKESRRFGIELTNTPTPDDAGGLRPHAPPRLVCNRLDPPGSATIVKEDLLATWEASELGDALARGLRAFPLRECVSIGVVQEVALPEDWSRKSVRVEFEITPYDRELDAIFVACGERSAFAPAIAAPAAVPVAAPAPRAESPWQEARVIPGGRTNVRAAPRLQSAIVAQLEPGTRVRVRRMNGEWWRAQPVTGAAFEGYIRQDRLVSR